MTLPYFVLTTPSWMREQGLPFSSIISSAWTVLCQYAYLQTVGSHCLNIARVRNCPDFTILVSHGIGHGVDYGVGHGVSLVVGPRVGHGPWGQSLHLKYSKLLSCLKF